MAERFGMIYYPGMRAIAYLHAFQREKVFPQRLLFMAGAAGRDDSLDNEAARHGYARKYFDIAMNPLDFVQAHRIKTDHIDAHDINAPALIDYLKMSDIDTWIFSGGGILRDEVLSLGKRFVHVHPGRLPDHRGSTTFYYSLLESGTIHATAFYMGKQIDDGPMLVEAAFEINLRIGEDQPKFMDAVLDPHIRSVTLERLLRNWPKPFESTHLKCARKDDSHPYFIIHPLLRLVCISRVNGAFDPRKPEGVRIQR